jgi:hypothetical protein
MKTNSLKEKVLLPLQPIFTHSSQASVPEILENHASGIEGDEDCHNILYL